MSTNVKTVPPTNGKTTTVNPLSTVKTEAVTIPTKIEPAKTDSIEDRLHRLNVLFDLQKKFLKWQETRKNLNEFEIAQNKENSSLEISDDEGNEFNTTNPVVIAEVVKLILQVVNKKITEVEAQIVF